MRLLTVTAAALFLAACSEGPVTPDVADRSLAISDALHGGGNEHFFWLPPMVSNPASFNGAFDGALSPVVSICDLADCANNLIAEYTTTTGPGSETVRVVPEDEHYIVNWHTDEFPVIPGPTYRISLMVAGTELGFADVELGAAGKDVKNLTTGEMIGLKDGRTLPIKFRIEEGIVGAVVVTPSSALIADDETQDYTATVTDLHGAVLVGVPVDWDISDAGVATLVPASGTTNGSGEHTATATPAGTLDTPASITARSQGMEGSAVLEVETSGPEPFFPTVSSAAFIVADYRSRVRLTAGASTTMASSVTAQVVT